MAIEANYNGYHINVADKPQTEIVDLLRDHGQLSNVKTNIVVPEGLTPESEAAGIAQQEIVKASLGFERTRLQVVNALRSIIGYLFETYDLPKKNGVDFGCGATGAMVEQLLDPIIDKHTWAQVDANPNAIAENQRRHPQSTMFVGSYLDTNKLGLGGSLDIATGLSSLDATQFIPQAVAEIRKSLKEGGYFLHIQDVRPGQGCCVREMQAMGNEQPYDAEIIRNTGDLISVKTPDEILSVSELFRRNLGRAIQENPRMDLILNQWITAKKSVSEGEMGKLYSMNILLGHKDPIEEVSVVATLAKKRS